MNAQLQFVDLACELGGLTVAGVAARIGLSRQALHQRQFRADDAVRRWNATAPPDQQLKFVPASVVRV